MIEEAGTYYEACVGVHWEKDALRKTYPHLKITRRNVKKLGGKVGRVLRPDFHSGPLPLGCTKIMKKQSVAARKTTRLSGTSNRKEVVDEAFDVAKSLAVVSGQKADKEGGVKLSTERTSCKDDESLFAGAFASSMALCTDMKCDVSDSEDDDSEEDAEAVPEPRTTHLVRMKRASLPSVAAPAIGSSNGAADAASAADDIASVADSIVEAGPGNAKRQQNPKPRQHSPVGEAPSNYHRPVLQHS